ncbi:hypothetical protein GLYMA_08G107450v4 [Glycine max]|nr:hypothetical protein GLYMA_08G107450v4 [Glycine max]KAH1050635.1 hypothetical protein GYH30_020871 [Glycine max]
MRCINFIMLMLLIFLVVLQEGVSSPNLNFYLQKIYINFSWG